VFVDSIFAKIRCNLKKRPPVEEESDSFLIEFSLQKKFLLQVAVLRQKIENHDLNKKTRGEIDKGSLQNSKVRFTLTFGGEEGAWPRTQC